jgi:hypothetical protein
LRPHEKMRKEFTPSRASLQDLANPLRPSILTSHDCEGAQDQRHPHPEEDDGIQQLQLTTYQRNRAAETLKLTSRETNKRTVQLRSRPPKRKAARRLFN